MIYNTAPQGSQEWLDARKGLVTGSKFKYARDKLRSGKPSGKCILYAQDVARERCGGKASAIFVNAAMKFGTEQEPLAKEAYETTTGNIVTEVGFISSLCGMYGLSPDGLIGHDGVLEVKTIVGSDNLFTSVVEEDFSEYIDQCLGYLLFLGREWVDLVLWAPDLEQSGLGLSIHRITRDEVEIKALKKDLEEFSLLVRQYESALKLKSLENIKRLQKM